MNFSFSSVAPYLTDPLTLVGFITLLLFSFCRALLKYGVIPELSRDEGASIVKRIILVGMILALAVIGLGFGLKYREMSRAEQERALGLLRSEVGTNHATLTELVKNTETHLGHFLLVAQALRHEGIPLLAMAFPVENLVTDIEDPDIATLAASASGRVVDSGLLEDPLEVRKAAEAGRAIRGTIERTRATMDALMDVDGTRYTIEDSVLSSHMDVLRKIENADVGSLTQHYSEWRKVRRNYDVVNGNLRDYFDEVSGFFVPEDEGIRFTTLRGVLTAERLALSMLSEYADQVATSAEMAFELDVGPAESRDRESLGSQESRQ